MKNNLNQLKKDLQNAITKINYSSITGWASNFDNKIRELINLSKKTNFENPQQKLDNLKEQYTKLNTLINNIETKVSIFNDKCVQGKPKEYCKFYQGYTAPIIVTCNNLKKDTKTLNDSIQQFKMSEQYQKNLIEIEQQKQSRKFISDKTKNLIYSLKQIFNDVNK